MEREVYVYSIAERKNRDGPKIFFRKKFEVQDSSKLPKVGTKINFGFLEKVSENFRSRQGEVTDGNGRITDDSIQQVWVEFTDEKISTDDLRVYLTEENGWKEISFNLE